MANGINKVILIGHLGNDPDMRGNETAVCNISVATTEKWKDKDGNRNERTEWHRVVSFGKLAEIMGEYLRKGSLVYIEGKLRTEKYTDSEGVEKYSTKVYADNMNMLGGGADRGESLPAPAREEHRPSSTRSAPAQGAPRRAPPRQSAPRHAPPQEDYSDDDIPF